MVWGLTKHLNPKIIYLWGLTFAILYMLKFIFSALLEIFKCLKLPFNATASGCTQKSQKPQSSSNKNLRATGNVFVSKTVRASEKTSENYRSKDLNYLSSVFSLDKIKGDFKTQSVDITRNSSTQIFEGVGLRFTGNSASNTSGRTQKITNSARKTNFFVLKVILSLLNLFFLLY